MVEPNHEALRAGVKAGKPNYQEILRAYRKAMYDAALAVFGSKERSVNGKQADDAVQAAMLEVYQKDLLTRDVDNIVGLLVRVTTRRALDMVRPTKTTVEPTADIDESTGAEDYDGLAAVERRVAAKEVYLGSIDHLTDHDMDENERKVFHQMYRIGRSIPDTAKELGLSEPGVRKIDVRLLTKLAKKLRIERDK